MPPEVPREGVCCITGQICQTIDRGNVLTKSFTEQHLLKAPGSPRVSLSAFLALAHKWERMSSWFCDGAEFRRLDRKEVRDLVIGGVNAKQWAGYITTSYKKHGSTRAPVNSAGRQIWLFEMLPADCSDRAKLADWWRVMNAALRNGIGRSSMETLQMPPGVIMKIGIQRWQTYRAWAIGKFESGLYKLLCYLLPSQEELKEEAESK